MADWTSEEVEVLKRLIRKAEADPDFTNDDLDALRQMADAFKGLKAFGRFAKWIVVTLAAIAGGLAAWDAITSKVRIWLGS